LILFSCIYFQRGIYLKMSTSSKPPEFTKMDFRVYIKMRLLLEIKPADIYNELVVIGGQHAPSRSAVFKWAQRFQSGRTSVEDDPRVGRPSQVNQDELMERVRAAVLADPQSTVDEIAQDVGISHGSCHKILTEDLQFHKICSRWVPHTLTEAQKAIRVQLAQSLLNKLHRWGHEGIKRVATGDETYCCFDEPGHRLQRQAWVHKGDPPPTTPRPNTFGPKVLYTIFFSCEGPLATLMAPPNTRVDGDYYSKTALPSVLAAFREKHPNMELRIHHDNAPAHRSQTVLEYLAANNTQVIPHPPTVQTLPLQTSGCSHF
jgi:[histone H3]-lysine36 N-dimethyltransferase SETMAR